MPSPITPDQIRCTFKRHRLPLPWAAKINRCKVICASWHNRFGACRVLDDDRLRALCRRLVDDQFSFDQVKWAILAYEDFCQKDAWHRENPDRRKTLANFLRDERFEQWVDRGSDLQVQREANRLLARDRDEHQRSIKLADRLRQRYDTKSDAERKALLARAVAELSLRSSFTPPVESGSGFAAWKHPVVRQKVMQYMQQEEREESKDTATPVSEVMMDM